MNTKIKKQSFRPNLFLKRSDLISMLWNHMLLEDELIEKWAGYTFADWNFSKGLPADVYNWFDDNITEGTFSKLTTDWYGAQIEHGENDYQDAWMVKLRDTFATLNICERFTKFMRI